jgi:hypothetical protein
MKNKILSENLKLFADSFKSKTKFLYVLGYDLLFYLIIIPLFFLFAGILNSKLGTINTMDIMSEISSGQPLTNITAAQAQQMQMLGAALQNLIYFFIIGLIIFIIVTILVFTLSRNLIWNYLMKKKFDRKTYLKFNLLNILFLVLILMVFLILAGIRIPVIMALANISVNFAVYVSSIVFLIFYIAIIYFMYLVYINYVKTSKISKSFRNTFKLIKTKFANIGISYLFIFVFSIIFSVAARLIWLLPAALQIYLNLAVVLLFLTWMKIYVSDVYKQK